MKIDKNTDKYRFINKLQSNTIIRFFNIVKFLLLNFLIQLHFIESLTI